MPAPMRVSKLRTLAVLAAALAIGAPIAAQHNTAQDIDDGGRVRSEEHTSELQSQSNLVCRLLLEKKKNTTLCSSATSYRPSSHIPLSAIPAALTQFPHPACASPTPYSRPSSELSRWVDTARTSIV